MTDKQILSVIFLFLWISAVFIFPWVTWSFAAGYGSYSIGYNLAEWGGSK